MPPTPLPACPPADAFDNALDADACYLAFAHKDAAWDGRFVMGVTSTRIYCRPVCRVRLPKRAHCCFFAHPAQAEAAGFRPCLRCRPELAAAQRWWSLTDAARILADSAAQRMQQALENETGIPDMHELALGLGVSDRHLRRVFAIHWQVSPLQFMQTLRLLKAKALLQQSQRSIADIAFACGYASPRGLHAAMVRHYRLKPSDLRPRA